MKKLQQIILLPLAFVLSGILLFSCTKTPDEIGLDLVENQKNGSELDTLVDIVAFSILKDSLRSDETTRNVLGSYYDPEFGETSASFCTQLLLPVNAPDFEDNPTVDSVIIKFVYRGYYGNISTPLNLKVYELDETIYRDSLYYSNRQFNLAGTTLADFTFTPAPNDSIEIDSVKYSAELAIHLDNSIGEKILTAPTESLASNDDFTKYLKGLYFTVEPVNAPGQGSLLYFDLLTTRSTFTVYYNDSVKYYLDINDNAARINVFTHDYSLAQNPDLQAQINGDTLAGDQKLFVECLAGTEIKIWFPNLKELVAGKNIALNDAILYLPILEVPGGYAPPSELLLYHYNDLGTLSYLPDESIGENYFGGSLDSLNNQYSFRITRYLQQILTGNIEYGLNLSISGKTVYGNKMIMAGSDPLLPRRMHLRLVYTKLDD